MVPTSCVQQGVQLHLLYAEPLCFSTTRSRLPESGNNILVLQISRTGPEPPPGSPTAAGCHETDQLAGMLFQGPNLLATYTWPLVGRSLAQQQQQQPSYITAAVALPPMETPGALQLVLVHQQRRLGNPAESSTPGQWCADNQAGWVSSAAFARLPLLFLPAGAAQEVEGLLAPAMRQEAAAAAAAAAGGNILPHPIYPTSSSSQQQQQGPPQELCIQATVWQHWVGLADDVASILSLTAATESLQRQAIVQQHVLPTVLDFLQQQDLAQFHYLLSHWAGQAGLYQEAAKQEREGRHLWQLEESHLESAEEQAVCSRSSGGSSSSMREGSADATAGVAARGVEGDCPSSSAGGRGSVRDDFELPATPTKAGTAEASSSMQYPAKDASPTAAAAAVQGVSWSTCWRYFPHHQEQAYVAWKSRHHLWLDQYAAAFITLHLLALLVRMVWEQDAAGSVFYLWFVGMRLLPYLPLAAGRLSLLYREAAWAAAQVLCVLPILTNVLLCDPRLAPYLQRWGEHVGVVMSAPLAVDNSSPGSASSSSSHSLSAAGDTAAMTYADSMVSMLRQVVVSAAGGGWQQQGVWLSSVCSVLVVPAAPMRALWACHGELAVVALIPLVQPLRLGWYLPGALLEVVCVAYAFALLHPLQQVVVRFATASCVAVVVAGYTDRHYRATFLRSTASECRACEA